MSASEISNWDLARHRFSEKDAKEVFIQFANLCSKQFMEEEPEKWYRFCDGNYTETAFHKEWLDLIEDKETYTAIECAREHHKTSFVLLYILYYMWKIPNFSVIYISATHGQATSKLEEWQTILNRNPWLDIDRDDENWSKQYKKFKNGSSIRAEGFGTALEGPHVQLIVLDDILQEEGTGAMSDEQVWNYYAKVVSPMVTESGTIILVGTKKRQGDIFDKVSDNPGWTHVKYPSTPENPIFPEKWPVERLKKRKQEMMARNFDREFGLEVIIEDDVLIPPSWNERNRDKTLSYPRDGWKDGLNVLGVDPAVSPTGDQCAFFSMSRRSNGGRFIIDVQRKRGMGLNDMIMKMHQLDTRYNYQMIMFEKNSFQRIILNEAIETTDLPIQGHETDRMKSDPSEGIPRISVLFENGKYIYPYKTTEDVERTEMVFKALNSLMYDGGKLTNNHTPDIVMAKYMAEQALRRWEGSNRSLDRPVVRGVRGGIGGGASGRV